MRHGLAVLLLLLVSRVALAQAENTVGEWRTVENPGADITGALMRFDQAWDCMPDSLKKRIPFEKEDIVIRKSPARGIQSMVRWRCGKPVAIVLESSDLNHGNPYRVKQVVAEEFFHSLHRWRYPGDKVGNQGGAAGALAGGLAMAENGYAEVIAAFAVADLIGGMGGLYAPSGPGPYPNDAAAKAAWEKMHAIHKNKGKWMLCLGITNIENNQAGMTFADGLMLCLFKLCKYATGTW